MDIHPPKILFLFGSFGTEGFKFFIVNNDKKGINKLLYGFKKCDTKPSQKLKLCGMKFCVETWQKNPHKIKEQLADTTHNIFHLFEQFAKLKKTDWMNIVQNIVSSTCGEFHLYFYKNLFDAY